MENNENESTEVEISESTQRILDNLPPLEDVLPVCEHEAFFERLRCEYIYKLECSKEV